MFRIEMLPAAHGDCLWLEYGTDAEIHRILIDGGPAHTYPALRERILHLPSGERRFDLLVVTHIDADHIEGVIRLLRDAEALGCEFDRIWFNGREQLNAVPDPAGQPLGAQQGEYLGILIDDYQRCVDKSVHNRGFDHNVVAIDRHSQASLPTMLLPGDCRLTLLSPDYDRLLELKDRWRDELREARVTSGDTASLRRRLEADKRLKPLGDVLGAEDEHKEDRFELPDRDGRDTTADLADVLGGGGSVAFGSDNSKANGSSIALLLEYPASKPKIKLLLAGDAWPAVLEASITKLLGNDKDRLKLTGFKLAHHGSAANLNESLLKRMNAKHYLVSTSGAIFRHPHAHAMELLLSHHKGRAHPRLHFNYLTETTQAWAQGGKHGDTKFIGFYPKGLTLEL